MHETLVIVMFLGILPKLDGFDMVQYGSVCGSIDLLL
jgi:hypothetical protein